MVPKLLALKRGTSQNTSGPDNIPMYQNVNTVTNLNIYKKDCRRKNMSQKNQGRKIKDI